MSQLQNFINAFNDNFASQPTSDTALVQSMFAEVWGITEPSAEYVSWWVGKIADGTFKRTEIAEKSIGFVQSGNLAEGEDAGALLETLAGKVPGVSDPLLELTTGRDVLTGKDGQDNVFTADLVHNANTFQSGDVINGGDQTDTLNITLGNASAFAIRAETNSVEIVNVISQSNNAGNNGDNDPAGAGANNNNNVIDAELMSGVQQWWNNSSRSDLTIEDVRSNSHETTIGWKDTDSGNTDYRVYFDKEYITSVGQVSTGNSITIKMANVLNVAKLQNPIDGFASFTFNVGETTVTVDTSEATSYADVVTATNAAITAAGITGVTAATGVAEQAVFSAAITDGATSYTVGQSAGTFTPIVITSTGATLASGTITESGTAVSGNVVKTMGATPQQQLNALTSTNIVLDNVGRGSDAGDLVIGNMSTANSQGIQQFNVTVEKSSWINSINTTNNSLMVMNVENGTAKGDLRIDTAMTDVRVVDGRSMEGDMNFGVNLLSVAPPVAPALLNLNAAGTVGSVAKYLNLTDTANDPAADNSTPAYNNVFSTDFAYATGSGNDTITLNVDNGLTGREDFRLDVNAGNGNNTVTVNTGNISLATTALHNNLAITTGTGNDTVTVTGQGKFVINTGAGDDFIYVNNNAAVNLGTWTVGAEIIGAAPAFATQVLYKANLTVNFAGFESVVEVPTGANFVATQFHVNQAIKKAIADSPVLSQLLSAQDGTGNALVIESLVGGSNQLGISIGAPQVPVAGTADATAVAAGVAQPGVTLGAAQVVQAPDVGTSSNNLTVNQSVINAGSGNDVIVLSSHTAVTGNTIKFDGQIGTVSIVNFFDAGVTTGAAVLGNHILDFTSYGTTVGAVNENVFTTGAVDFADNKVSIITFAAANYDAVAGISGTTFANLDAAKVKASIDSLLPASLSNTSIVAGKTDAILMVQNNTNVGEYKIFEVDTAASSTTVVVNLIGTIDFGASLDAAINASSFA
ncbi:beta strand repeat-containing protein [Thiomicrospira microaerophila]|uniref:beta strand repeat-containing protein n=1 Tax=Thiomicrospira microaerophila TaxID=406020 RepID=UPI0005C84E95|nr:hypothetical protein [Thiomicrospira microaerophila]